MGGARQAGRFTSGCEGRNSLLYDLARNHLFRSNCEPCQDLLNPVNNDVKTPDKFIENSSGA